MTDARGATDAGGRMDRVPERMPPFGAELSSPYITLHAVLVRDGKAHFDDDAVHGTSDVEAGIRWVDDPGLLETPERWRVVWVAATHEPDGTRSYTGLAVDEILVERRRGIGYREDRRRARRRDAATRGEVELDGLSAADRVAVRRALIYRDPDAWDRASEALVRALEPVA